MGNLNFGGYFFTLVACGDKPSEEIGTTCVSCDNIVSKEGVVYSSVRQIKNENYKKYIGDRQELINIGYTSCKRCNP